LASDFQRGFFGTDWERETMSTTADFRTELRAQITRAVRQDRPHVEVNAGELHRVVGGYPPKPGKTHSMPSCCNVMRDEMKRWKAKVIHRTGSGQSPSLTIRYYLK
jgi:5-methylcytosine-specific restriction protein A